MTTKVTIDAHAGWPVRVTSIDLDDNGTGIASRDELVPAGTIKDFYIHSHMMLTATEQRDEKIPA